MSSVAYYRWGAPTLHPNFAPTSPQNRFAQRVVIENIKILEVN